LPALYAEPTRRLRARPKLRRFGSRTEERSEVVRMGKRRAFGVLAVALVSLVGVGSAVATTGKHRPAKTVKRVVRAGVHADVSVIRADGTSDAFAVDRGQVTASSTTSLTLLRLDGQSVTLAVNQSTRIRGQIQTGRRVLVFSRAGTAFRVLARRGRAVDHVTAATLPLQGHGGIVHADVSFVRADRSTDSRAFDRGQVTAASLTSLTLHRRDGHSVSLAVNGATRIRGRLTVGRHVIVISKGGIALRVLAGGRA
jgi:hypothetical protein